MFKKLTVLFLCSLCIQCSSPKKGNVAIEGTIRGLKKGTLYLQKIQDTLLINIDSLVIDGDPSFAFQTDIEEPEIHYLYLDKHDGKQYNDRIDFFVEPGLVTVFTTLNEFERDAVVNGGKNQMKFQEFKKMNKRFNDRNLRILKEDFEARKQNDNEKLSENDEAYDKLMKQKYYYTINFAVTNKKLEVAPYVTLHEIFDANIKYLDTVVNALSPKVKKSIYGQQLIDFVEKRKEEEKVKLSKPNSISEE